MSRHGEKTGSDVLRILQYCQKTHRGSGQSTRPDGGPRRPSERDGTGQATGTHADRTPRVTERAQTRTNENQTLSPGHPSHTTRTSAAARRRRPEPLNQRGPDPSRRHGHRRRQGHARIAPTSSGKGTARRSVPLESEENKYFSWSLGIFDYISHGASFQRDFTGSPEAGREAPLPARTPLRRYGATLASGLATRACGLPD